MAKAKQRASLISMIALTAACIAAPALIAVAAPAPQQPATTQADTLIHAGRVLADPASGRVLTEQSILVRSGRIVSRGPFMEGMVVEYGPTAVLDVDGVQVIVTSLCKMVADPAFFDLHGIDLATLGLLAIKAKNQFRAAFTGTFTAMIDVDTPGPAMLDFTRLPFRTVPPTRFPFGRNAFAAR